METYIATNTTNGKFYIGSSTNFEKRKKQHLGSNRNYPFQNALREDPDSFEWKVWSDDSDERILEQALLDMWYGKECCYNLNPIANQPPDGTGSRHSEDAKNKISKAKREAWEDPEYRRRLSVSLKETWENPEYRRKHSEALNDPECRRRRSEVIKEAWKNPELKERHSEIMKEAHEKDPDLKRRKSEAASGRHWYVNREGQTIFVRDHPGEGWKPGRIWKEDQSAT